MTAQTTTTTVNVGAGTPASVGGITGSYVGLYGATPVVRAAAITALSGTIVSTGCFGYATSAEFTAVQTAVNSIITALQNIGVTL